MSSENNDDSNSTISTGSLHSIEAEDFFDYVDPCFFSPLYVACVKNNAAAASEALQKGKAEINRADNSGNTYLHTAVIANSVDVVKLLLGTRGIRLNAQNHQGDTSLHMVQDAPMLKILVDAGTNLNAKNNLDETPLLFHLIRQNFETAYEYAKILLAAGANPNLFDHRGMTIFYNIMYRERFTDSETIELVSMLLYYGGDVNLKHGCTSDSSFMYAVRKCSDAVIELMIPYVTDFNEVSPDTRYSVLMCALSRGSSKAVDLIQLNADVSYSLASNSCLSLSLTYVQSSLFKYIWKHCDKTYVLHTQKLFLRRYLNTNNLPKHEFLNNLYTIISSKYGSYLIEEVIPHGLYEDLVRAFLLLNVEKDDRIRVIYTLLSISNRILAEDLYEVYTHYGFNEELEAFMVVNVEILNFVPFSNFLTRLCYPFYSFDCARDSSTVKTLRQMSRDVIRENLRRHVDTTYFQYYNGVQQLHVPQVVKDIICLKKPLEPMLCSEFSDK